MSRNQRIGLLLAALAVAVVAVVVAVASGGGDDDGDRAAQTTQTASEQPHETLPTKPSFDRVRIRRAEVVGGPPDIKVKKGRHVVIVVSSDAPDDLHLHGYDIEKPVKPGEPAQFNFTANIEGIFELESHVAEDAGREPLIAKLTVEPR